MTKEELALNLKQRIDKLPHKYDTVTEQMHYQQGVLLGLLANLSYHDSHNLDLIMDLLNELGDPGRI